MFHKYVLINVTGIAHLCKKIILTYSCYLLPDLSPSFTHTRARAHTHTLTLYYILI